MIIGIALLITATLVVVFYTIHHLSAHFEEHFGTPPPQHTEDEPDFLAWVERKVRHLED